MSEILCIIYDSQIGNNNNGFYTIYVDGTYIYSSWEEDTHISQWKIESGKLFICHGAWSSAKDWQQDTEEDTKELVKIIEFELEMRKLLSSP